MRVYSFKSALFMLIVTILLWSSNIQTCIARRGKHWRQSRSAVSASVSKNKGRIQRNSNHHNAGNAYRPKRNAPLTTKAEAPTQSPPKQAELFNPTSESYDDTPSSSAAVFNVLDFGAKGNGDDDDTRAFEAAWAAACKVEASTVIVPAEYVFLVGPISFSGPYCQHNIVFQLDGTIIAPTNAKAWGSGILQWLEFSKLVGITVTGSGVIDGRGSVWWQSSSFFDDPIDDDDESKLAIPLNSSMEENPPPPVILQSVLISPQISSSLGQKMPSTKPTALRFYGSFNVTVSGITIQNSQQCHLKFDSCIGVSVYNFSALSPGDSPNTDGIHLQNSKDVLIRTSNLACGDDCVSIQTGCTNVYIHNVNCGPGHGISIGSLGRYNTRACVSNITVRDINMRNTMNGVRIKTWQGGSGTVQGVYFKNIQVSEVQIPIVIDQFYCDKSKCSNQTSGVALSGINYENIRGTYTVKPVHFACSDSVPCREVILDGIQLTPIQEHYHLYDPYCWQTYGQLHSPAVPPIQCLQLGKPSNNHIQTDQDSC